MVINSKKFFGITLAVIIADQLAKMLVTLLPQPADLIPGVMKLSLTTNTGIAFGLFPGNNLLLSIVSISVIAAILKLRHRISSPSEMAAAALIAGGTAGNLIDRLIRGSVLDYISFPNFPTFNIADAALTLGAVLIIAEYLREKISR